MTKSAGSDRLQQVQMPLRDALRGVSRFAEATEAALEPAARLLPGPLRAPFHSALKSMEKVGNRLTDPPVTSDQIAQAAAFLTGETRSDGARMDCVMSLAHGWDTLTRSGTCRDDAISETLLSDLLARLPKDPQPVGALQAARVLIAIHGSGAIARLPGIAPAPNAQDRAMTLMALGVWLLTRRADTPKAEDDLIVLSNALVRAMGDTAQTTFQDPAPLATALTDWANHL